MKRGNDDEKIMGPMFPRLHVNDTDKGGPRAPPRNKMALYEQLTVPTQRYNIGAVPLNPSNNNNSSLVSSTSASPVMGREANMCFPFYRPPLAPSYDELQVRQPETMCMTNELTHAESRKKHTEEDDFTVPLFSQPGIGQSKGNIQNSKDGERLIPLSSDHSMAPLSNGDKQTNTTSSRDFISRHLVINQDGRNCSVSETPLRSSDTSTKEKDGGSLSEDTFEHQRHQEKHRLSQEDDELAAESRYGANGSELPLESPQKDISSWQRLAPHVGCGTQNVHKGMTVRVRDDNSLERENIDRGYDVSDTSMVDFVSEMDISPDDVVEVIGRKHFWKARTAIVNQQRVFAIQVFELHRLIKVQKLIAESPHLLLESSAFLGKTSLKEPPLKKYTSDYGVKAQGHTLKQKDNSQKPADKLEGTAENAVAKVPIPSPNSSQPSGYPGFPVSPTPPPPVNTDQKMGPWAFQQPPVHQWLVPVMSPSEGLVYKPYPALGMMGPMYGCCGPPGPTPLMGNMMSLPYVMPNPHYHQGMGASPGVHFGGQGCFPTYPMPTMSTSVSGSAVDQNQMNPSSGLNPYNPMGQPTLRHQNSCNMPSQKKGLPTPSPKAHQTKEGELQGSTASSPSERSGTGVAPSVEGTDTLSLFPTGPGNEISEGALPTEKPSRVIRVVPHNAKSTRESAARIFQSIQAERRQYESS